MATTGIAASDDLDRAIAEAASSTASCVAVVARIAEDGSALEPVGDDLIHASSRDALAAEVARVVSDKPRYVIASYGSSPPTFVVVMHVPSTSSPRERMMYAATLKAVKLAAGLDRLVGGGGGERTEDADELIHAIREGQSDATHDDHDDAEDEARAASRIAHAEARSALPTPGAGVGGGDAISLGPGVATAIEAVISGTATFCAMRVDVDAGSVELVGDIIREAITAAWWRARFPTSAASNPDPAGVAFALASTPPALHLVQVCPDGAHVKQRMLFALSQRAMAEAVRSQTPSGVAPAQGHRVTIAAEFAETLDAAAAAAASPAGGGAPAFRKPKRPGRGKRALVARPAT